MGKRTRTSTCLLLLLTGALLSSARAQDTALICDEQVQSASRLTIVIAKPESSESSGNQESSWMSAFIEEFLYFRLGAVQQLLIVPSDTLAARLPSSGSDNSAPPGEQGPEKYLATAKNLNASYLLFTEIRQAKGARNIRLSLGLVGVQNATTDTFASSATVDNIETSIDSCLSRMLAGGSIPLLPREKKLLAMKITGSGKNSKTIGVALSGIKTLKGKEHENVALDLKKLVSQDPTAYLAYYTGAREFAKASRFEDAALLLRDLIMKIGPSYPALYPLAARNFRLADLNEDALQIVNMAQGMKLTTDALLLEKALVFEALEDAAKAEGAYSEVLVCDSTNYEALLFMTKKLNKDNRSFEALTMAKRITANYPNQGVGYLEMGKCLIGLKQSQEAKTALERAADLLPGDGVTALLLGDLCVEQRDYNRAFDYYERAMKLAPQNVDIHVKAAHTSLQLGNPQGALEILKKVEKQFYDNTALLKEIGTIEFQLGDTVKAQRDFNRFCENGGRDAAVFTMLGSIHESKDELVKAREFYEKAQLMEPGNPDIREKLTQITVKINLADKGPGPGIGEEDRNAAPSSGNGSMKIGLQIGTGVLCLGSVVAGVLIDRDIAKQYSAYQTSRSVDEINSLHSQLEKNVLYRNVLYCAGALLGVGCSITFVIPSKH